METSIFRYIWAHTKRQQVWILVIVALSMIPYYMSFDLPKMIVNGPIQGTGFETPGATQPFMALDLDLPWLGTFSLFSGIELDRLESLLALSLAFLALVIVNGLFKFYINTFKGRLGERLLRRLRFELIDRILRFPPQKFKRIKAGEVSSMVKDEVEPMGGFSADAFVQPALLGGQALTALVFIFIQHFWLGTVAFGMAVLQVAIIPRMRRRLIVLGRERQLTARQLAGRVSEIVEGVSTIHSYDTSNFERADIAARLGRIFKIRYDIYQWKFLVKFINNFLAQVTPFLFYSIGGYLTIMGRIDVGQLVAVINAYKELPGPLKELIDWDLARQDVQVKYEQVVEQFDAEGMTDPLLHVIGGHSDEDEVIDPLSVRNLGVNDDNGGRIIENITLQIPKGEIVALLGSATGEAEALGEALGRVVLPSSGQVCIGARDIHTLPERLSGRLVSYVSSDSFFFSGSLMDNLVYGLKHAPAGTTSYEGKAAATRRWETFESQSSGNPDFDLNDDWIDYSTLHPASEESELVSAVVAVLEVSRLTQDVFDFALRSVVDVEKFPDLPKEILDLRVQFHKRLEERNLEHLVVPFHPDRYNTEANLGENLMFGVATVPMEQIQTVFDKPYFKTMMRQSGFERVLYSIGVEFARNTVELFSDLPEDHSFFQLLTYMRPDELPEYAQLLQRVHGGFETASDADRRKLVLLSLYYIEPRYRFGLLDDALMARIVLARHRFHASLDTEVGGWIERYDPEKYLTSTSMMENILFGKINNRQGNAQERIREIGEELVQENPALFRGAIIMGLEYNVGPGGRRLSALQRQKLSLARALIRRSSYYVFNRPLAGIDPHLQEDMLTATLAMLKTHPDGPSVIWVLSNTLLAHHFNRVISFENGHVSADGTFDAVMGIHDTLPRQVSP